MFHDFSSKTYHFALVIIISLIWSIRTQTNVLPYKDVLGHNGTQTQYFHHHNIQGLKPSILFSWCVETWITVSPLTIGIIGQSTIGLIHEPKLVLKYCICALVSNHFYNSWRQHSISIRKFHRREFSVYGCDVKPIQ